MRRWWIVAGLAASCLFGLFTDAALAHPASGIVVNAKGEVFFIHTGHGVCKIDTQGKLAYIHRVSGGGHFMALDPQGLFSTQLPRLFQKITPEDEKPAVLYASGGAPFVVNRDGNLYYGSGYPEGDDLTPGGLTLTRLSRDGKRTLFAPDLKANLAKLNEAVTGLANAPDGSLLVACPNAILKVHTNGTATTVVHPVEVQDCDDVFERESDAAFFHAPYLRGLDVTEDGTIYAAVTGCRCVVKIAPSGKIETALKSEKPWTPTGIAVRGNDVFVLEYANHADAKSEIWFPRVRKLGSDGKVVILASLAPDE